MQDVNKYVISGDWRKFLTMPNERLLVVTRKHPLILLGPLLSLAFISLLGIVASVYLFIISFSSELIAFTVVITIVNVFISLLIKIFIDWYFNLYIATTRKILEVRYSPLASFNQDQVLLDQVKCTEIDTLKSGLISDFIDMGNIAITFDRPTHHDIFYLENIRNSRVIGIHLSNEYAQRGHYYPQGEMWYRDTSRRNNFAYFDETFT